MKLIILTLFLSVVVAYLQGLNWKRFSSEDDGANMDRILLGIGNSIGFLVCVAYLVHSWGMVKYCAIFNTLIWLSLYRIPIRAALNTVKDKLHKIFHRKIFP